MFDYGFPSHWSTLKKLIWLRTILGGGGGEITTVTGISPLLLVNAIAHRMVSLTQYGKCVQDGANIVCNNGAIKYGWHDIITTTKLSGYGTYVSPAQAAGNRAYRWFKDLPNGTYTFAVDGDYEIIVQWRSPADPADGYASVYENLSGWITSGEVTLDKSTGGYGIAVRRTSGTDSITPSNFDGVLHVQEQGLYVDGTPEVLTVSGKNLLDKAAITHNGFVTSTGDWFVDARYACSDYIPIKNGESYIKSGTTASSIAFYNAGKTFVTRVNSLTSFTAENDGYVRVNLNAGEDDTAQFERSSVATDYESYVEPQTASVANLFAIGNKADKHELIHGPVERVIGFYVFTGNEANFEFSSGRFSFTIDDEFLVPADCMCTGYTPVNSSQSVAAMPDMSVKCGYSGYANKVYLKDSRFASAADLKADFAARYAAGDPVMLAYVKAESTTEQATPHALHTVSGTNVVDVAANVSNIELEAQYMAAGGAA